jgi:hypothetical protein
LHILNNAFAGFYVAYFARDSNSGYQECWLEFALIDAEGRAGGAAAPQQA